MYKKTRVPGRRDFLKKGLAAAGVAALSGLTPRSASGAILPEPGSVALSAGEDRAANVFQSLSLIKDEIAGAVKGRKVLIKPNNVSITRQLAATHVDCLEGTLEFLRSIGIREATIAESTATGTAMEGFESFGYRRLKKSHKVEFMDLDDQGYETAFLFDQKTFQPIPVRLSSVLLNKDEYFIISAAVPKTHDRVVCTLSLKNIVFGAPLKDKGFRWGRDRKPGTTSDKPVAHGSGHRATNYNIFTMAPRLHPDLALIDGYRGMEGNGPTGGDPVEHRVALAGTDWLAADRTALELMGVDSGKVGYLNYCARAGYGKFNPADIRVLGEKVTDHRRTYRLSDRVEEQLSWQKEAVIS